MWISCSKNSGKNAVSKSGKENPKKIQSSDNSHVRQILHTRKRKEKKKEVKGKRKRLNAAQWNDLPPLVNRTDLELQIPHDSDQTCLSCDNNDGNGKGPPKKPPGGNARGAAPSPSPSPPPIQEEAFVALLAETLRKTMNPDRGRRLTVKATEKFNDKFTKFRGWWKVMQRYLRIYVYHIPDDTTRIDVVSTYLDNDVLLRHEARERLLEQ